jgi:Domain of unknown function (DUF5916)/Carbohydrate family 9 binding domain-like
MQWIVSGRHLPSRRAGPCASLALLVGLAVPASGQDGTPPPPYPIDLESAPRPFATAVAVGGTIDVDGALDEDLWKAAVPISDFIQSQPDPGFPPTERTVVRIIYDDDKLYIGAMCYDSEPDQLVITSLEHDFGEGGSTRDMDIFAVTLDTFLDRRNSFMFLVNPGGAFRDGQTFNDSRQIDFAWRAIAEVKTMVNDSGYTVEMAIPWTTLRFRPQSGEQSWGMNLLRRVRRKNEDSYWAPVDRRDPVHRMSKAGTLEGLAGLRTGRNLQVKPFGVASGKTGESFEAIGQDGGEADAGFDIKWGVTSGLTLDGTFLTDFSQVEVDAEQVNLTRFPLFFPERREFFVENSGSFILGDVSERNYRGGSSLTDFTLFHSRRIGLEDGQPIAILGGVRLTGREGQFEVGALDMQTTADRGLPAENFAVARVRRNFGASDAGVMFINRQAVGDGVSRYNRSFGVDANLHALDHLIINSYLAGTAESGPVTGDRWAGRVSLGWRDQVWDLGGFVQHVGDAFNPGVGFVRRRGVRHAYATIGAHPRPAIPGVQEINPYGELHYVTDLHSDLLTREGTLGFGVQFLDGATLNMEYQNSLERLLEPDEIAGVVIPAGQYVANTGRVSYTSSRARPLSGSIAVAGGGFFNGTNYSVSGSALWRAHYRAQFEVSAAHNDVTLSGQSVNADVYGVGVRLAYSTELFARATVQFNGQTDQLVTNVRLNWIYAPVSDVFLVYTERRLIGTAAKVLLERSLTAKITRLLAF